MPLEIFDDIEQGSDRWHELRSGLPTASVFTDIMAKGEGKMRRKLLYKIAGELLTKQPAESYGNGFMDRGKRLEPEARRLYAMLHDHEVQTVGFLRNGRAGASPDALCGEDGGLEIKTVTAALMIEMLERGADNPPPEHKAQIQGNIWVSGRNWWDLIVYCPKMPPAIFHIKRDPGFIVMLAGEVARFNNDVDTLVAKVRRYGASEALAA